MGIRREEEMEMSDDENGDNPTKKMRVDESGNAGNRQVPQEASYRAPDLTWGRSMRKWPHNSLLFELH